MVNDTYRRDQGAVLEQRPQAGRLLRHEQPTSLHRAALPLSPSLRAQEGLHLELLVQCMRLQARIDSQRQRLVPTASYAHAIVSQWAERLLCQQQEEVVCLWYVCLFDWSGYGQMLTRSWHRRHQ
jgi:hypothetical protein